MTQAFRSTRARAIAVAVTLATLAPVAASAAWTASSSGGAEGRARTIRPPANVAASSSGVTAITVSWQKPTGTDAAPPDAYRVERTSPSPTTVCTTTSLSCIDTGLASNTIYNYSVVARRGTNWVSGAVTASATTPPAGTPSFLLELVTPGAKTAGNTFDVRVTARTGTTTDTWYTGARTITWSGPGHAPSGQAPSYPSGPVTFTNGVATASVTLYKAESAELQVADGARSGNTAVGVDPAVASALRYTSTKLNASDADVCSSGSGKIGGQTFSAKVSRFDAYGNGAAGDALTVTVTRSPSQGTLTGSPVTIDAGESESAHAFDYSLPSGNTSTTLTAAAPASPPSPAACALSRS